MLWLIFTAWVSKLQQHAGAWAEPWSRAAHAASEDSKLKFGANCLQTLFPSGREYCQRLQTSQPQWLCV